MKFKGPRDRWVSAAPFQDAAGNEMWSVNVVVGDDAGTFIEGGVPLQKYKKLPSGAPITWWIKEAKEDGIFVQQWDEDREFRAFAAAAISLRGLFGCSTQERSAFYRALVTRPRLALLSELAGIEVLPGTLSVISNTEFETFDEVSWRALLVGAAEPARHAELLRIDRISPVLAQQLEQIPLTIWFASILSVVNRLEVSNVHWRELQQALHDAPVDVCESWIESSKAVNSFGSFWDFFAQCTKSAWKPFALPEIFFASPLLQPLASAGELESEAVGIRNWMAHRVRCARLGREAYFRWKGTTPASVQLVRSNEAWTLGQIKPAQNESVDEDETARIIRVVSDVIASAPPTRAGPDPADQMIESVCIHGKKVWPDLVDSLISKLQLIQDTSLSWDNCSYCIVEVSNGYVQFMSEIGPREEFLCEIQSHHFVSEMESRLTDPAVTLIIECGFQWPEGRENFARWFSVSNDDDVRKLAEFALGILGRLFGAQPETSFLVKTHVAQLDPVTT